MAYRTTSATSSKQLWTPEEDHLLIASHCQPAPNYRRSHLEAIFLAAARRHPGGPIQPRTIAACKSRLAVVIAGVLRGDARYAHIRDMVVAYRAGVLASGYHSPTTAPPPQQQEWWAVFAEPQFGMFPQGVPRTEHGEVDRQAVVQTLMHGGQ